MPFWQRDWETPKIFVMRKVIFITRLKLPANKAYCGNVLRVAEAIQRLRSGSVLVARCARALCREHTFDTTRYGTTGQVTLLLAPRSNFLFFAKITILLLKNKRARPLIYTREPEVSYLAEHMGLRVGLHLHTIYPKTLLGRLRNYFLRNTKHPIFPVSEGMASVLIEQNAISEDRVTVIRNGVNLRQFQDLPSRSKARERLNISEASPVCVYSGSLYTGRGIDIIMSCAMELSDVQFSILGGDTCTIERLRCDAPKNVVFHGYLDHEAVRLFLRAANILLMPYQENIGLGGGATHSVEIIGPLKLYEYMASGTAIISSRLGALEEVLDETTCSLVEPSDAQAWSAMIKSLLGQPHLGRAYALRAQERVAQYDLDLLAEKSLRTIETYE